MPASPEREDLDVRFGTDPHWAEPEYLESLVPGNDEYLVPKHPAVADREERVEAA